MRRAPEARQRAARGGTTARGRSRLPLLPSWFRERAEDAVERVRALVVDPLGPPPDRAGGIARALEACRAGDFLRAGDLIRLSVRPALLGRALADRSLGERFCDRAAMLGDLLLAHAPDTAARHLSWFGFAGGWIEAASTYARADPPRARALFARGAHGPGGEHMAAMFAPRLALVDVGAAKAFLERQRAAKNAARLCGAALVWSVDEAIRIAKEYDAGANLREREAELGFQAWYDLAWSPLAVPELERFLAILEPRAAKRALRAHANRLAFASSPDEPALRARVEPPRQKDEAETLLERAAERWVEDPDAVKRTFRLESALAGGEEDAWYAEIAGLAALDRPLAEDVAGKLARQGGGMLAMKADMAVGLGADGIAKLLPDLQAPDAGWILQTWLRVHGRSDATVERLFDRLCGLEGAFGHVQGACFALGCLDPEAAWTLAGRAGKDAGHARAAAARGDAARAITDASLELLAEAVRGGDARALRAAMHVALVARSGARSSDIALPHRDVLRALRVLERASDAQLQGLDRCFQLAVERQQRWMSFVDPDLRSTFFALRKRVYSSATKLAET